MGTIELSTHNQLSGSRRVIVKIGSALLVDDDKGEIRGTWLSELASDIAGFPSNRGCNRVVRRNRGWGKRLELPSGELALEQKQAAAATGHLPGPRQQQALGMHNITVAQILLTLSDTEERRRHLNARATIETLLKLGAIPGINEHDTVATEEIRYGDNVRRAGRVAHMISADTLVLLSDVDGLYNEDPRLNSNAHLISEVTEITPR